MGAYGAINDGEQVIAWVQDGEVRRNSTAGELVGYEKKGEITDLGGNFIGHLETEGTGKSLKAWWSE